MFDPSPVVLSDQNKPVQSIDVYSCIKQIECVPQFHAASTLI